MFTSTTLTLKYPLLLGFLQKLASHDVFEYYWRVYRDRDQKSVVERQRVMVE